MKQTDCVICNLVERQAQGDENLRIVYESEFILALHATKPYAEVHIMIVSKEHIPSLFDLSESDNELIIDLMRAIKIASEEVISLKGACKMEMYLGELQHVNHFHCHIIYDPSID